MNKFNINKTLNETGNLGFFFKIGEKNLIIITKSNKFRGNIILGFENFLNFENKSKKNLDFDFFNLSNDLKLDRLSNFNEKFKYAKIKVNDEKMVDFNDFLFYFTPKDYLPLRNLFLFEDEFDLDRNFDNLNSNPKNINFLESKIISKVVEIHNFFS